MTDAAKMDVPTGIDHLALIERGSAWAQRRSHDAADDFEPDLALIGTSLSALYQAATCHRKCHGGPHLLEALCGRVYNLGSSAYLLAIRGFYDESLNLLRSVGEIANLIALSVIDKPAFGRWVASDKKARLTEFSPFKVRKRLEKAAPEMLIADDDWYSRFCESYTHATPHTRPNVHNGSNNAHVGGTFQATGYESVLGEVATLLASVAMLVCRYFKYDDLFAELQRMIHAAGTDDAS